MGTRQSQRHAIVTECVVLSSASGRLVGDRTVDLSWDGLQVHATGPAGLGEPVRVSLRIPRSQTWVEATAVVSRRSAGRRTGERGETLGLRIVRMHPMDRVMLATISRGYPIASPADDRPDRDYARAVARISTDAG